MANTGIQYGTSAVGRLIMGDPFNKQTKDQNGRDIPVDKQTFFFGIACEKTAPGVNEHLGTLQKAALEGYANVPNVMQQVQMGLAAPQFSWKVQDGDEMVVDPQTGQHKLRNQYAAGCWIFKFSTTIPIRSAKFPPQSNVPVDCDPSEIKRGYFVQVSYSTQVNGNLDHTAGVYQNPKTICLVGFGEEIVSGPSLEQQFAGAPTGYSPQGMTMTPQAPMGAPGSAGTPAPGNSFGGNGEMGQHHMANQPVPNGMPPAPGNAAPAGNMPGAQVGTMNVPSNVMPMGNAAAPGTVPGMPPVGTPGNGAPNPLNNGQTVMPGASPSNGMPPAPGNPMQSGMPMPAGNGQNMATTSHTNPPPYGGYMNQQ